MIIDFTKLIAVDYFVLIVIALSALFAGYRGFLGSIISFFGWFASIYLAYITYPQLAPYFKEKINSDVLVFLVGHTVLLAGFLVVFAIINFIVEKFTRGLAFGFFDKILGAMFGAGRGAIIVAFLFLVFNSVNLLLNGSEAAKADIQKADQSLPKWLVDAQTYPYLLDGQNFILQFIPSDFIQRLHLVIDKTTKTNLDERFVENITSKLSKSIKDDQRQLVNSKLEESSLQNSIHENDILRLKEYFEVYLKSDPSEQAKSGLTNDDIRNIKDVLHKSTQR